MLETGLAARLLNVTAPTLAPGVVSDVAGGLTEALVAGERRRQLGWSQSPAQLCHFRDRNVDLVPEEGQGRVATTEVKTPVTVRADDFRGLMGLQDRLGDRVRAGVAFHSGAQALPFGDRLAALPISSL